MHGRRRWIAAGLGIAAAAALAPATASAAGLIAAYDYYVPGKGFEIGLKNAQTGANIALPAAVNSAADELHPALSADGRYLAFTRMTLQPKLNGDIVAPQARSLFWVDRQTGTITQLAGGAGGVGPVFTSRTTPSSTLSWGTRPEFPPVAGAGPPTPEGNAKVGRTTGLAFVPPTGAGDFHATGPGPGADIPHAASISGLFTEQIFSPGCQPCTVGRDARYLSVATHNAISGALERSTARLSIFGQRGGASSNAFSTSNVLEFGAPGAPGGHPVPRSGDGYVALDLASGSDVDIQSITYPGETALTPAPAPITTADPERMPAWSPDGIKLGFIRTTGGRRLLGIFNSTPGIQTVVNPPVDIGADAPTPQTRQFQSVYGGLAVAESNESTVAPQINCTASCINALKNASQPPLKPNLSFTTSGQTIGIFVVRVTGKRKLLGRSVPKVRLVGRVPLGRTRKGTNLFRWNLKVNGKRLKPGTYLLTYRALKRNKVLNTSDSIRFTVTKSGKIRNPRRQR